MVAWFNPAAVPGFGVATRVGEIVVVPLLVLTACLGPLVGQNWSAGDRRVHKALRASASLCLAWGVLTAVVLFVLASQIVALLDADDTMREAAVS